MSSLEKELTILKSLSDYDQVPSDTTAHLVVYSWGLNRLRSGDYYIDSGVTIADTLEAAIAYVGGPGEKIFSIEMDPGAVTIEWYRDRTEHGRMGEVYAINNSNERVIAKLLGRTIFSPEDQVYVLA